MRWSPKALEYVTQRARERLAPPRCSSSPLRCRFIEVVNGSPVDCIFSLPFMSRGTSSGSSGKRACFYAPGVR